MSERNSNGRWPRCTASAPPWATRPSRRTLDYIFTVVLLVALFVAWKGYRKSGRSPR